MSDDSRKALRAKGLKIRAEVLGQKYVDAALNNVNEFNGGLQNLLNEYCWGNGWGDDTLTRRERSLINLGMLTALGRTHEVAVHVRGAKNNGLSNDEIAAVFLQTAIYCGVPAAVDSFRAANPVIAEWDAENPADADKDDKKGRKSGKKGGKKSDSSFAAALDSKSDKGYDKGADKDAGKKSDKSDKSDKKSDKKKNRK